jgi:hypothetical protein
MQVGWQVICLHVKATCCAGVHKVLCSGPGGYTGLAPYTGWLFAGIGANYINVSPDFAEKHSKSHRQNPIKALETRIRRVSPVQLLTLLN